MAKKFERCVLHIGTEKTGTTTLQEFLLQNSDVLEANGYFLPRSFGIGNHVGLVTYAMDDHRVDDTRIVRGVTSAQSVKMHRKQIHQAFEREVESVEARSLILTSEHCHSRLVHDSEIARLKSFLSEWCASFQIIVYLRPQHELALSMYSTAMRNGEYHQNPIPQVESNTPYYDYLGLLNRWQSVFGRSSIVPRLFSKPDLIHADVCRDFLKAASISGDEFRPVSRSNESLNVVAQAFLRMINPHIPLYVQNDVNPLRADLVSLVESGRNGKGILPSRDQIKAFMAIFSESNELVRKEWFPDRTSLFCLDLSAYPEVGQVAEISLEDAFAVFADVWLKKQRNMLDLRAELEFTKGMLSAGNQNFDVAERHFRQAIKLDKGHAGGHRQLAEVVLRKGAVDEALSLVRIAIELAPERQDYRALEQKILKQENLTT